MSIYIDKKYVLWYDYYRPNIFLQMEPQLPAFLKGGGDFKGDRVVLDPPLPPRPRQNLRPHPLKRVLLLGLVGFLGFVVVSALFGNDPTDISVPSEVHKR